MMFFRILTLLVATTIAAPRSRHTTTSQPHLTSQHIYSSADDIPMHLNYIVSDNSNNNTTNNITCSSGTPWHQHTATVSWPLVFQSPRVINALAYLFFFPFVVWQGCLRKSLFRRNRKNIKSGVSSLYYLLAISFLMRACWLFMEEANWCTLKDRNPATHSLVCPCFMVLRVLNRFSMLLSFSAFSVIAIFWAEVVSQARHAAMNQNVTGDDGEARNFSNDGDDMENEGAGSLLTSGTNDEPVRDCCNPGKVFKRKSGTRMEHCS